MATGDPIRLGSATGSKLIFQSGSSITTSDSGIQAASVIGLCPDGANVFSFIPKAGDTYDSVFGNTYLPSDFKVDYTGGGAQIDYEQGTSAKVTLSFKRPDPATSTGGPDSTRKISVDSALNYKSILSAFLPAPVTPVSGAATEGKIGFPEPIATVKYNSTNPPPIGGGTISSLYALPTDPRAAGFPATPDIKLPYAFSITQQEIDWASGTITVGYWNGTSITTVGVTSPTTFKFNLIFKANPLGWQLTKLKWDPVSGQSFYDVEEDWRTFYFFYGVQFIGSTHP